MSSAPNRPTIALERIVTIRVTESDAKWIISALESAQRESTEACVSHRNSARVARANADTNRAYTLASFAEMARTAANRFMSVARTVRAQTER